LLDFHRVAREPPFHFLDHEVLFHLAQEEVEHTERVSEVAAAVCALPVGLQRRWRIDSFRLQLNEVCCGRGYMVVLALCLHPSAL
jgi:hypothetical protein